METTVALNGTDPLNVYLVTFVVPGASLALSFLKFFITFNVSRTVHAAIVNAVLLFVLTILSEELHSILFTIYFIVLVAGATIWKNSMPFLHNTGYKKKGRKWWSILDVTIKHDKNRLPFIEDYRGHLLLATAISILAVDFPIFPEKHAKTETYGWSVMDAGVGCFVAVHGMCSSQTKRVENISFKKSVLSSIPLFILGFLRLIAVKATNYENVSEYGVHWNFFFTLAITKLFSSGIIFVFPWMRSDVIGITIMIFHQWLLSSQGVTDFVLSKERSNIIQSNKEGICSVLGFISIYFLSVEIGKYLKRPRYKLKEWLELLCFLLLTGVFGWIIMYILHQNVQPISRKMANSAYCVWVITLICLQIAIHLLEKLVIAIFHKRSLKTVPNCIRNTNAQDSTMQSYLLWKAINYNGLLYFLAANILTGVVNLSMSTSDSTVFISLFVICTYLFILSSIAIFLHKCSIKIKFW